MSFEWAPNKTDEGLTLTLDKADVLSQLTSDGIARKNDANLNNHQLIEDSVGFSRVIQKIASSVNLP